MELVFQRIFLYFLSLFYEAGLWLGTSFHLGPIQSSERYFDQYDTIQENSLFLVNSRNCLFF